MSRKLLDISGEVDAASVILFSVIAEEARLRSVGYLVVGATARDLILHHVYGLDIERGTRDVDFAIEVSDWSDYGLLSEALVARGFRRTDQVHRLMSPEGLPADIIPFGNIANERNMIHWPPEGAVEMNVLGFREAIQCADWVRIAIAPPVDVPVASPVGLVLLKLVAWRDRERDKRAKDAIDLKYLLQCYERIPAVATALYDDLALLERYDGDTALIAAHLLGGHVKEAVESDTAEYIAPVLQDDLLQELILDMDPRGRPNSDTASLIGSFANGFF